jgi:hypothetical protein
VLEALAALVLYATAVVWLTWPLAQQATSRLPATVGPCAFDTPLISWILAHETRALTTAPAELPHGNQYHPARFTLFYGPTALGALPLYAPVFLATGNPALAINLTLLGGAALTAWTMHLLLVAFTRSHLAGMVAASTFLMTRWLFWNQAPTNPFYACLELCPLIMAVAARPDVRIAPLLGLVVLQCLSDVAYVAAAMLAPLTVIGLVRLLRPATRPAGLRTLAVVLATPVVVAPVYAGYALVASQNPDIALQTNWRGLGSKLFPWLGQHLTELPWGPIGDMSPASVAPVAILLVLVGLVVAALRGIERGPTRSLWGHALLWTVVGFVISLTPAVTWRGRVVWLPHAWLADWKFVNVLREPERLAIASLIGLSVLAGLAFARCTASARAPWRAAAATLLLAATYVQYSQGFSVPFRRQPLPAEYPTAAAPAEPALVDVLRQDRGPVLEVPVGPNGGRLPFFHAGALYRSIYHRRPIVNGYAGYWPQGFAERMELAGRLPDPDALDALRRETGLATIVVHQADPFNKDAYPAWEKLAAQGGGHGLQLVARVGDDLVFAVRSTDAR